MTLIKLTNNADHSRGLPLYMNPDNITAVYERALVPGGSLVTIVFSKGIEWYVEEGLSEVTRKIEDAGR